METSLKPLFSNDNVDAKSDLQGKHGDQAGQEQIVDGVQDKQRNQAGMGQDDVSMVVGDKLKELEDEVQGMEDQVKLEEQEADVKTEVLGTEDQAGQEWLEDDAQDNEDDLVNHTGLTDKVETDPNHDYE